MSTLKANTLSNVSGTKSVPTDTVADGTAKAWANFNGTGTVAARDSFNVSSLTDFGTGSYGVNFSVARPAANYAPVVSGGLSGDRVRTDLVDAANHTTAQSRVYCTNSGTTAVDASLVTFAILGAP